MFEPPNDALPSPSRPILENLTSEPRLKVPPDKVSLLDSTVHGQAWGGWWGRILRTAKAEDVHGWRA